MRRSKFVWPRTALTEVEERVLATAKRIARELVPDADVEQTYVVEEFPQAGSVMCTTEGMYRNGIQYIRRGALAPPPDLPHEQGEAAAKARSAGILIHERLHGKGFMDGEANFGYEMSMMLAWLALERHEPSSSRGVSN